MECSRAQIIALADYLDELSEDIERIGASLCGDLRLVESRMAELQGIDLIAQKQRSIAGLLRADCAETALQAIGLEQVQQHFSTMMPTSQ